MRNRYGSRAVTPTTNQPGFWQTIGDQIPGLARGAYSGLLGLPGDAEEIAMAATPYALLSQGKISPQRFSNLATQDYSPGLLTSEEIASPLRKEGLLSKRPLEGEYTELAGNFLSPDFFVGDIAKLGALGVGASIFTSPAQKAVREVAKDALPSQQWLKQLEGRGVKKDELEWTGLLGFLKGKKGNIQKSEVEDFIEANKIDVQEVVKGSASESDKVMMFDKHLQELEVDLRKMDEEDLVDYLSNNVDEMGFESNVLDRIETQDPGGGAVVKLGGKFTNRGVDKEEVIEEILGLQRNYFEDYPNEAINQLNVNIPQDSTKFSEYQLPGGENYRELVLTLPNTKLEKAGRELAEFEKQFNRPNVVLKSRETGQPQVQFANVDRAQEFYDTLPDQHLYEMETIEKKSQYIPDEFRGEHERLKQAIGDAKDESGTFTGSHMDEPNALSHIRFNERVDPDGKKVLFIEEIQSDWAQKGRKVGFSKDSPELQKELEILQGEIPKMDDQLGKITDRQVLALEAGEKGKAAEIMKEYDELGLVFDKKIAREEEVKTLLREGGTGVPRAPFLEDTNQWAGLSMKRMVKWASDEGFDSIGWTTGKQQAARYDLSKQISEIHLQGTDFSAFDHSGNRVIQQTGVRKEDLPDLIGKEAAEKLMKQPNTAPTTSQYQQRSLKGQDLEVGGEGMAGFYDKILVDQAKKIGKKHGAKVEKNVVYTEISPSDLKRNKPYDWEALAENFGGIEELRTEVLKQGSGEKVWSMKIPDKLKKAAKEGLPYYALVPPGLLAVGAQRERQSLLE